MTAIDSQTPEQRGSAIIEARDRWIELLQSDEHLLGALPEELSVAVLDEAVRRVMAAAADATDEAELAQRVELIRGQLRDMVDRAAEADDPAAVVSAAFGSPPAAPGETVQGPEAGSGEEVGEAEAASPERSPFDPDPFRVPALDRAEQGPANGDDRSAAPAGDPMADGLVERFRRVRRLFGRFGGGSGSNR